MPIPSFSEFRPSNIKWQHEAHKFIYGFDYSKGVLEVLFSGAVGSAKTSEQIHELVADMLEQPGSKALMVRRTIKDLKRTSWNELLNHLRDIPHLVKSYNKTDRHIIFINGSEILGDSYDDGDEEKYQSLDLSHLDVEECNEMPRNIFDAIKLRVGRAGVKKNRIQMRCNPDEPDHWLHKYFIQDTGHPCKKVFYSLTEDNPYLPKWYLENLKRDLTPLMARRKLYGEWLSISGEGIYYNYDQTRNFKRDEVYEINPAYPVCLMHDFNIGHGKPMSAAVGQFIEGVWHIKKTYLLHGFKTRQILEEMQEDGVFEYKTSYLFYGDQTGNHNDSRGNLSDWEIIEDFAANLIQKDGSSIEYSVEVPTSNPPIKRRWKNVNLKFLNSVGFVGLIIYKEAADADEGFRLTKLKKGSGLIEDDSFEKQHVTTAIGYAVDYEQEYGGPSAPIIIE